MKWSVSGLIPPLRSYLFCSSEQLNKPVELHRNVIGSVDFTVPVPVSA
jgi:hypothetical protein